MRRLTTYLAVLLSSLALSAATADDAKAGSDSRLVAIEVLIADLVVADEPEQDEAVDAAVARVRDAEKQGKLSRVTRLRLTTLSDQQAMAQFGERAAVATGRASFPGGGRGAGSGNITESFSYQNVGTIVQITPRVEGNKVLMDCNVEQSRLVPKGGSPRPAAPGGPDAPQPAAAFHPESIETITAKSVLQMKSGQTVLLTSRQQHSGSERLRTYILVTGTIQGE